jgi:transcriptional regulator with XRE-family HTH domain
MEHLAQRCFTDDYNTITYNIMSIHSFINDDYYSIFQNVKKSYDVRKILSGNIKAARKALHITQAKLAEHADIALPSLIGIEHRKTWVSDKTLIKIAQALNMEVYQLLVPPETGTALPDEREAQILQQVTKLLAAKRVELKKTVDDAINEVALQIIRLYSE